MPIIQLWERPPGLDNQGQETFPTMWERPPGLDNQGQETFPTIMKNKDNILQYKFITKNFYTHHII